MSQQRISSRMVSRLTVYKSDLLNSLNFLISQNHYSREEDSNVFSYPAITSAYIYHNRGNYRDNIDVYCNNGKQSTTIKLDGDKTKVIEGSLKK